MRWAVLICAVFWAGVIGLTLRACATTDGVVPSPPARYVAPTIARVHYLPLDAVRAACVERGIDPSVNPWACAQTVNGVCEVLLPMPRDVGYRMAGQLLEWEMARCWGMKAEHER